MSKCSVAVIFGGASSEYEVSLRSAAFVISGIDPEKYDLTMVGITKLGIDSSQLLLCANDTEAGIFEPDRKLFLCQHIASPHFLIYINIPYLLICLQRIFVILTTFSKSYKGKQLSLVVFLLKKLSISDHP